MKSSNQFLLEKFNAIKERNPRFTVRALAQKLQLKSHSHLSRILSGSKPVPLGYLPVFVHVFKLKKAEMQFLEYLIMLDQSKTEEEITFYENRLREIQKRSKIKFSYTDKNYYLMHPLYPILLELTETKDFIHDLEWIKRRIPFKTSKNEISLAIDFLKKNGLLTENNNCLTRTYQHMKTLDDNVDKIVKSYHKSILNFAEMALENCPLDMRMFNNFCLPITSQKLQQIKNRIKDFTEDLITEIEADSGEGDEVYQLNINFFPMTKIKENLS